MNKKAFTLIELIIVIAIVSLIAAAVFVSVNPAKRLGEAKDSQRLSDLTAISKAVNLYTADHGELPEDLEVGNIKIGDKVVLCSQAQALSCDGQTHDCMVIDDTDFLDKYLNLPVDPNNSNDQDTGYYVSRGSDRSIVFGACDSYGSGANLKVAATTKVEPYRAIYRSVGPYNTSALATGTSNALDISGHDATFATALVDNIGVGDVIQYDSDNNGTVDSLAFIQGRYSSTHYSVVDVNGDFPTETTAADNDWDIFRAYTSLWYAERGTENTAFDNSLENFDTWTSGKDLVAADQQWNIVLYGDAADANYLSIADWTTSPKNYLKIYTPVSASEVGASQRHAGVWDNGKYRLDTASGGPSMIIYVQDVKIEGLQVRSIDNTGIRVHGSVVSNIDISNNIVRGNGVDWRSGINVSSAYVGSVIRIWNNLVYDMTATNGGYGIYLQSANPDYYVYNNTVLNCKTCIQNLASANTTVKNNITQDCSTDGYTGTFNSASDYNISDLASDAPGSNSKDSTSVTFLNEGSDNFHLAVSDTAARDAGTDLSNDSYISFSDDIDGAARSGTWDIGADEY